VLVAIAPRWGERSLSLPFALYFSFQNFSFSAFSPGLHRAGTCAAFAAEAGSLRTKHRHGSARARDGLASFATAPLHCISASKIPPPFHCVPTAANWRDRQNTSGAPQRAGTPEAARLRPARLALAREASPGQGISITARGSAYRRGRQQ
jgi:hypothetical protein